MEQRFSQRVRLQALDPLSKLVTLLCIAALCMHWDEALPLAFMLLVLIGIARFGAGMSWGSLGRRMGYIAGFGVPLFAVTLFAAPAGETVSLGMLAIPLGALSAAAAVCLRMFCLFISSLVYIESTDPKQFVVMMTTRLKMPYRFVFGVSMALTFLPLLAEEAKLAGDARKIRSARAPQGIGERLAQFRGRLLAVFTGAIRRIEQTAGAMDAKGFGAYPERTFLWEAVLSQTGVWLMGLSVMISAGLWFI